MDNNITENTLYSGIRSSAISDNFYDDLDEIAPAESSRSGARNVGARGQNDVNGLGDASNNADRSASAAAKGGRSGRQNAINFTVLTFLLSLPVAFLIWVFGRSGAPALFTIGGIIYMFMPLLSAIILLRGQNRQEKKKILGISFKFNRWFVYGWLIPLPLAGLTFLISLLIPGVDYSPTMAGFLEKLATMIPPEQIAEAKKQIEAMPVSPLLAAVLNGLLAGITINALVAFGEEAGWRGYLLYNLRSLGFWKASLVIGAIWGVWHAPLIIQGVNYPDHPIAGVFMMTIWTCLLSPVFIYVRLRSGSVVAAAIVHGSLNALASLAIIYIIGGSDLTVGVTGLAGFLALGLIVLAIYLHDKYVAKEPIEKVLHQI